MSGQQIGSVVGGIVGSFIPVIGTALGSVIGGMIGGWIAPTQITGPKLTDGMAVTAQDGIANPWGFGTFPVGCNIIWTADIVEHEETDDGKGSGQEVTTYRYTRSYAVGICRGNRATDGTYTAIAGILRATKNGKVVYDTSTDAAAGMQAQNAKFLENHTFYLGGDDQLPDPTIESYLGAGNAHAYPGQVYMVAEDDETTRGEVAQWEFVVATGGTSSNPEVGYSPLTFGQDGLPWKSNANSSIDPRKSDAEYEYAYSPLSGGEELWRDTLTEAIDDAETAGVVIINSSDLVGWTTARTTTLGSSSPIAPYDSITGWQSKNWLGLCFSRYGGESKEDELLVFGSGGDHLQCASYSDPVWAARVKENSSGKNIFSNATVINSSESPAGSDNEWACYNGGDYDSVGLNVFTGFIIVCRPKLDCFDAMPDDATALPGQPGYWVNPDGTIGGGTTCETVSGDFRQLSKLTFVSSSDGADIDTIVVGPTYAADDQPDETGWTELYDAAVADGTMESGLTYGVDYPVTIDSACLCSQSGSVITPNQVTLASIVAECCFRSGLTSDDIDVSQLTDLLDGFKVASLNMTGESIIQSLMPGYFFAAYEADDLLKFVKLGGDPTFELTIEDLAEREGDALEEIQAQEVELLRKVHVKTMDPAAGYVVTTQTAERRTSTVAAKGEQVIEIPVVTDHDTAAQMANKRMKAAWGEPRRFKYTLPYTRPDITPTDVGWITDRKGRVQMIRVEQASEDEGRIETEASLNRQAAYTSNVSGVPALPPVDTSPGIIGPTLGWVGNLPSLRTSDNVPGVYVGGRGYLPAWGGYALFLSADDGESYQRIGDYTKPTQIGNLTDDVTASGEPIPVFMPQGALSTITDTQLANRGNAFAITTDGESEIGQFKTATPGSSNAYDLTDTARGLLGTDAVEHNTSDPFVMLAGAHFVPLDISLAGKDLLFKFVTFGTSLDDTEPYPFTFLPKFTSVVVSNLTVSGEVITVSGEPIYVVT